MAWMVFGFPDKPPAFRVLAPILLIITITMTLLVLARAFRSRGGRTGRVTLDLATRRLIVEHMRIDHRRFWPSARIERYECSLDEVRWVRYFETPRRHGRSLTFRVPAGEVSIDDLSVGYDDIARELRTIAPVRSSFDARAWAFCLAAAAIAGLICWVCVKFGWI